MKYPKLDFKTPGILLLLSLGLSGCGDPVLDGSSDEALMKSYIEMKKGLSERNGAAFDLAFHKARDTVNEISDPVSRDQMRVKIFSGKTIDQLVENAKSWVKEKVDDTSKSMQTSANCYRSYENGLEFKNKRMKNSSIDPENRVELSFDLFNGSNYTIPALQIDLTMEIFGAPDYERKYDGTNYVRCFTPVSVPVGGAGRFTCNIRYNMGQIKFDGPVEDMQVFDMKLVNNDSDLQDGKEDKDSFATCKKEMEQHRAELKTYTSYMEQLMLYQPAGN